MQILVIILVNLHSYCFLNIQKTIIQTDKVDFLSCLHFHGFSKFKYIYYYNW
jgi:hypothetical protein